MTSPLIVDDYPLFCEAPGSTLEEQGYRLLVAHTLARAAGFSRRRRYILLPDHGIARQWE